MTDQLIDLLEKSKDTYWIMGEPAKGKLCIRITEEDRLRLLRALRPWWAFFWKIKS